MLLHILPPKSKSGVRHLMFDTTPLFFMLAGSSKIGIDCLRYLRSSAEIA